MSKLRPSELDDIAEMKQHLHLECDVSAHSNRLFEILATGENQHQWASGYQKTVWHSEARGVGSVRDIYLDSFTVRERFLVWQPGHRFAFSSEAMSPRVAREMIEDIAMIPLSESTTHLVWDVHVTLCRLLAPISERLVRDTFSPMFESFCAGLASYASEHPHSPTERGQ
jgi:hypothetical protein